ncbi:unnamed protein product [Caenorhabditis angaria]|uniref:Nanos-type domain-containing protein n=1 Tax=Caenorhabditis angaria TaxID=860376 RepID=A0A9P1IZY1_9PELO|nr:unnamed protein product [Caenorhabditis angaria]
MNKLNLFSDRRNQPAAGNTGRRIDASLYNNMNRSSSVRLDVSQNSQTSPETSRAQQPRANCCSFCWNLVKIRYAEKNLPAPDKDSFGVWSSHSLAYQGSIKCPLLWFHSCKICGATESAAHTEKNCPNRRAYSNNNNNGNRKNM